MDKYLDEVAYQISTLKRQITALRTTVDLSIELSQIRSTVYNMSDTVDTLYKAFNSCKEKYLTYGYKS